MMTKTKLLLVTSVASLAAIGATPAFAAGTTAGTAINNTATVNFSVGGVVQTAVTSNTNTITVDRRANITVAEIGTVTTSVAPGATNQVTAFRVTNSSNAVVDIGLTASQIVGGTAAHGGTDTFDVTGLTMYRDVNGNGTYEAGTDTAITFIDELAADASVDILLVGNIPTTVTNGAVAEVNLQGQVLAGGAAGTQGAVLTATAGANTAGIDTVLQDAAGTVTGDVANDGRASDDDDYTVAAPTLTVNKQSRVVSDPVNGTTNPKMIPGAVVEYCIVVANGAGSANADGVAISDPLPAQTTYQTAYGIFLNGTYTGTPGTGTCNLDGTAGGSITGTTVSGNLGTISAGQTRTLYFRVTIN
jgi:hypothetical protein